jgi:molecular chaperone HtpG
MNATAEVKGNLSVNTENIFPIIKKFLYSDHEIFLRELISNAVDATQKLKRLASLGEYAGELGELKVEVSFDKDKKTITVSDNGVGMTVEEIQKYINQIAFSGATEFIEKYKNTDDAKQIIGHFGLGFYSAFMVSKSVEIITRSYKNEGNEAARWQCDGSTTFTIEPATRETRGTDIILHIAEDSEEFLERFRLSGIIKKYCKFLPVDIYFEGNLQNNKAPLWTKSPSEITDEEYLAFYKELYPSSHEEPQFWIHLNVDYPFNLTGILFFPKIKQDLSYQKDRIQLYSRQVFITDEVKDIVPEFLMLLHGVIDSPDIPLNVSRSYLQADGNVKKINSYITRKVAEKLADMFKANREDYEKKWENIGVFVKFGIISDEKFAEKMRDYALVKNIEGKYFTFSEYEDKIAPLQTNKNGAKILLYANDTEKQHAYIQNAKKREYDVLLFDGPIDSHFINRMETAREKVSFKRVDADTLDELIEKEVKIESLLNEEQTEKIKSLFTVVANSKDADIHVKPLNPEEMPVSITLNEFMRRFQDMSKGSPFGDYKLPTHFNVVVNANHPIIQKMTDAKDELENVPVAKQLYDLALLSQNMLVGENMTKFIERSVEILKK